MGYHEGHFTWPKTRNSRGEQMHSFNAVFSKKGPTAFRSSFATTHRRDRYRVVSHWKKLRHLVIPAHQLGTTKPDLDGKLRISVGNRTISVELRGVLLDGEMKKLNSKFQFGLLSRRSLYSFVTEYVKDGSQF